MGRGRHRTTPASGKQTKVVCRICGIDKPKINRQSYSDHLKKVHNDYSGNMREWGQASLFSVIDKQGNDGTTVSVDLVDEEVAIDKEQENVFEEGDND